MFDVEKHTIYKVRHGSHAYGCNIETSDEDFKGVAIAPMEYYLSPFLGFEQSEKVANKGDDFDEVIYDVQKFLKLATTANPNLLELLFVDESDIVKMSECGKILLEKRDMFVTKQAYKSFSGYAISQFRRLKNHRSWLLDPPKKKPERQDFGLSITEKMSASNLGAYDKAIEKGYEIDANVMQVFVKEKQYAAAKRHWDQYQTWKETRNEKRAKDEAKFGLDLKHAYHLVRLSRMGLEILEGKGVMTRRPDAEELIAIRRGAWSYDDLEEWFEKQDLLLEEAYKKSTIKESVSSVEVDKLSVHLISKFHSLNF